MRLDIHATGHCRSVLEEYSTIPPALLSAFSFLGCCFSTSVAPSSIRPKFGELALERKRWTSLQYRLMFSKKMAVVTFDTFRVYSTSRHDFPFDASRGKLKTEYPPRWTSTRRDILSTSFLIRALYLRLLASDSRPNAIAINRRLVYSDPCN